MLWPMSKCIRSLPLPQLCLLMAILCGPGEAQRRPNFVIMMADDLGFTDLGIHGNPDVETPNLDRLARESVRFSQFYAHPVCAPTRASLLTGRHFLRTGVWGVHGGRDYMNMDEITFADALGNLGYATGLFGKWHNGKTAGYEAWDRGFDDAFVTELYYYQNNRAMHNGREVETSGWVTERIADRAIGFIQQNVDKPFVAYLPFMAPHLGKEYVGATEDWHAPADKVEKYQNKGLSDPLSRLYGMIDFLDAQVGRILQALEDSRLAENTVVMFLSDNGMISGGLLTREEWERRNPTGLRGNKGTIYENGIRVPLFVRWPGRFPPSVVEKSLVSVIDVFPTLLDLAMGGTENIDEWLPGLKPVDGRSFTPLLFNPYSITPFWTERTLFYTVPAPQWTRRGGVYTILPSMGQDKSVLIPRREGAWAIRKGQKKFLDFYGNRQLFDMESDPTEMYPLDDPAARAGLEEELQNWWEEMVYSEGSFTTPSFNIGWPGTAVTRVLSMAAIETSPGIVLRSHASYGWAKEGDYAFYKVNVVMEGLYSVRVGISTTAPLAMRVSISCGERSDRIVGWVKSDGYLGELSLPVKEENCLLGLSIVQLYIKGYALAFSTSGMQLEDIEFERVGTENGDLDVSG